MMRLHACSVACLGRVAAAIAPHVHGNQLILSRKLLHGCAGQYCGKPSSCRGADKQGSVQPALQAAACRQPHGGGHISAAHRRQSSIHLQLVAPAGPGLGEAVDEQNQRLAAAQAMRRGVQPAASRWGQAGPCWQRNGLLAPQQHVPPLTGVASQHSATDALDTPDACIVHQQVLHAGQRVGEGGGAAVDGAEVAGGPAAMQERRGRDGAGHAVGKNTCPNASSALRRPASPRTWSACASPAWRRCPPRWARTAPSGRSTADGHPWLVRGELVSRGSPARQQGATGDAVVNW